ncbi:MAG: Cation-transporting P-type ATPase [Parcubacteria group bacterium GW2011_GWA1_44_13]|uniref:Cation-transporting P-type ATPase n=1 Tax=Candidatus Nomurabacteria bacterium GW2011_GWB1_44_12 TaxID=1618748 RepID=A0A837I6Z6_9BACT|nr:MAG: Cation-transporting P-type ATPase [Candidatus Nomurabacteria bacterium GW2011_GWB1_44_12]KKT38281.1 MAG: Cation-transporting P-type ATPase [Parcubacteria group bacterium GW2011_GWA1_44_13]KKT60527.1 MAG: ATPase, P-type (Transporting), HAD superfamily, subfamily IC [Parcubacteria group bacterium GW2011_GWC1_44_26]HBB44487.1 ATPase [Candidatus Yonathbacteria bacterium]
MSENNTRPVWHTQSVEEVFSMLGTDGGGLSANEAEIRLKKYGENKLPETKPDSLALVFLRQFESPLIYVLIAAGGIVLMLGEAIDAGVIFAVLFINAIIGSVQEGRAQNTLASLKKFVETRATVLRDGREVIIPDTGLVPGDIIVVQEGERVPADARLISIRNLRISEAALTGESTPVRKTTDTPTWEELAVSERRNMIFRGTHITTGTGRAIVVGTGLNTEIGVIAKEIVSISSDVPLKIEIGRLARLIIFITMFIASALFTVGIMAGKGVTEMFLTVVTLSVSVIPEGLPIVLTIVLATGVWRMGKRNALVKKMHAVEALGQVDILAVDKTGTLTRNEMVVQKIYTNGKFFKVGGVGYEPHGEIILSGAEVEVANHTELLLLGKISSLCANARVLWSEETNQWNVSGDPTEAAMLVLSQKLGFHKDVLENESPIISEMPFDYNLKYHAVLNREGDTNVLSLAGAPEIILDFCNTIYIGGEAVNLSEKMRSEIESVLLEMSKEGLRVIALATFRGASDLPNTTTPPHATFVGFLGMHDALRVEVASTVMRAREAGVRTVMITGDHRATAESIATEAGIFKEGDKILTGRELDIMSPEELASAIKNVSVFARVTPEHKIKIIRAYKSAGNIVAMTGDGVNDAPSLSAADLGVSMGVIGTEVAKSASDIVLLDDNLNSIISAIEEGRSIYKTIKKVILYLFSTSAGEVLTITGAILLGYMVPILPAQIIWLNFVTDGFLDVSLAMEPKEKDILLEKRSKESRRLVDRLMYTRIIIMASVMAVGTLYLFGDYAYGEPAKAWTISLTLLAVFQWFNAVNCRSHKLSIFQMNPFSNLYLLGALVIVVLLQMFALYTSLGQKLLHTVPLSPSEWGTIFAIASSIIVVEEIRKFIHRIHSAKTLRPVI